MSVSLTMETGHRAVIDFISFRSVRTQTEGTH